jgi:hypothetical protein
MNKFIRLFGGKASKKPAGRSDIITSDRKN